MSGTGKGLAVRIVAFKQRWYSASYPVVLKIKEMETPSCTSGACPGQAGVEIFHGACCKICTCRLLLQLVALVPQYGWLNIAVGG